MRVSVALLVGVLVGCGGQSQLQDDPAPIVVVAGRAAVGGVSGKPSLSPGGEAGAVAGGAGGASEPALPGGTAGASTAVGGDAAGAPVASGGSVSSGGAGAGSAGAPARDDTGCIERPLTGNVSDLEERYNGIDCSGCSNGLALGYLSIGECSAHPTCGATLDAIPGKTFVLLPPVSPSAPCITEACNDESGTLVPLPGYVQQVTVRISAGSAFAIEVDEHRRVLHHVVMQGDFTDKCEDTARCMALGGPVLVAVVAEPNAPRGWLRITQNGSCAAD